MGWMQTRHGHRFYPEDVKQSTFVIEDIAHALSNLCRFGGHCTQFYSVAEHSVLVAEIVRRLGGTLEQQLWALMHDATEAYMVDVPTPVKVILKGYREKEAEVMEEIASQLKLPSNLAGLPTHSLIHRADAIALVTEAKQLVAGDVSEWEACKLFDPIDIKLKGLHPEAASAAFLARWFDLQRWLSRQPRRS